MKTSELTGAALDWAVHYALNGQCQGYSPYEYSTNWAQGGPIIECEGLTLDQWDDYPRWRSGNSYGTTPLIAAMRCYVASKLGDEVEIPEELT
jgi:hypothetical protein